MAFTVQEYLDLVRLLAEHPEWRSELRRLLLSDELLELPQLVRELVEAQRRTEEHLERLESVVTTLAGDQRRTADTVGDLKGRMLEITYREKAMAYFGPLLRRPKVMPLQTVEEALETHLSPEEFKDVLLLDLLVKGKPRTYPDMPEVWLAVEISTVVDLGDLDRVRRRAARLRQSGYRAIPVVAGERVILEVEDEARRYKVVVMQDGRVSFWEEALQAWVTQ